MSLVISHRERGKLRRHVASLGVTDFIVRTTGAAVWLVETKGREELDLPQKMARLQLWCADAIAAEANRQQYDFVFVDQDGFEKHTPNAFATLATSFTEYKSKS